MSVRKRQRNTSRFQVQDNATILCMKIIVLVQSDFGIKTPDAADVVGQWQVTDNNTVAFSAEIQSKRSDIAGASLILECDRDGRAYMKKYRTWLITHFKEELWKYAQSLSYHIRSGNTINPIFVREYEQRRLHQDEAMSACLHLIDLLEQMKEILHISVSKVDPIIELLHSERRLIHEWRRSDYRKYDGCMKNEKKLQLQAISAIKKDLLRSMNNLKHQQAKQFPPDLEMLIDNMLAMVVQENYAGKQSSENIHPENYHHKH